uniref:Uncharacterized protein n=1 Tax=Molossus molossus TaxID=27622 RepID=A0A7J8I846_MOLMO|nr:hypothetical protein HJG59_010595 [Molossus molossus]
MHLGCGSSLALVGGHAGGNQSMCLFHIDVSLSPSFPLYLKIHRKIFSGEGLKKRIKMTNGSLAGLAQRWSIDPQTNEAWVPFWSRASTVFQSLALVPVVREATSQCVPLMLMFLSLSLPPTLSEDK